MLINIIVQNISWHIYTVLRILEIKINKEPTWTGTVNWLSSGRVTTKSLEVSGILLGVGGLYVPGSKSPVLLL